MSVDEDPENLELTIYDLNDPLTDEYEVNSYDLIHSRFIGPGIHKNRWPSYVRDLRKLLKPGGWLQMVEYYLNIQSDNGRLTDAHALSRWYTKYAETMQRDRDPRIGRRLEQHMRNAGLKDVTVKKFDLHIGPWSRGTGQSFSSISWCLFRRAFQSDLSKATCRLVFPTFLVSMSSCSRS